MDYKIVGNEYTSPDFDADLFAREMIEKCEAMDFPWQQIRMDEDGRVYAFAQSVWVFMREARWGYNGTPMPRLLTRLDGNEVSWQDFGIIRTEEADVDAPERTIADITNERIALLWTAIDELREWFEELETKTPDTVNTTLTPELIAALSDWPDSALETIAQAIADGRIVLQ